MNINATLLVQALSFAALIWFAVRFIWPPLTRAIDERNRKIADGLAAAERGHAELATSAKKAEAAVTSARARAGEIIDEAKVAARAEGQREKAAAAAEIEQMVSQAKEQLREEVAKLAVAGAEKILRREVDAKAHADILTGLKAELR
jgi:F-type H+-transporting ATPase subunit b